MKEKSWNVLQNMMEIEEKSWNYGKTVASFRGTHQTFIVDLFVA